MTLARMHAAQAACFFIAAVFASAANANPYYDPGKAHHTPEGFRNNYSGAINKPFSELAQWRRDALREGLPKPPQTATPVVAPDLTRIHAYQHSAAGSTEARSPSAPAITWIGHATVLAQAGGLNVLTDPIFSERASPVQVVGPKRAQAPGVPMDALPRIDVVVISHNHYDHLDRASVVALYAKAQREGGSTVF